MIGAGAMNWPVQFQRRAAVPASPGTAWGGFSAYGGQIWAAFRATRPEAASIGAFSVQVPAGTLTILDSAWARTLAYGDRVTVSGRDYEVRGVTDPKDQDGTLFVQVSGVPDRGAYAGEMAQRGEIVTLRRGAGGSAIDVAVRARITGYQPDELVGGIQQGDRRVILLAADVDAGGLNPPIQVNDGIYLRGGKRMNVQSVDDSTHRVGDELMAYEVRARG